MNPLKVLTEYFLGQIYIRYRRPSFVPSFPILQTSTLIKDLISQQGLPQNFETIVYDHFERLGKLGGKLICLGDPRYPRYLSHIPDPPWAINILGNPNWLNLEVISAIIGSRKAPPFSIRVAFELGRTFATKHWVVVSGGAFGCDIAAHHGCLASGSSPLAAIVVLAGGVDHRYPRFHAEVFEEILNQGGAIVSERLCGYQPKIYDFPIRNRIIAGMAQTLYVVSAGRRSGAMITARKALDYGRDVYVLQPNRDDARHDGMKDLLFDGAIGFDSVEGLLENAPVYL